MKRQWIRETERFEKLMVCNHPDFQIEHDYLMYTKDYIKSILEISEKEQENYEDSMKEAFINLDYLDSSLSYINILTNARLLDMLKNDLASLIKVKDKPYFGRVDFLKDHTHTPATYYIGKVSLYRKDTQEPIIVDWRSPVSNLYYDGRLGDVSYQSGETTYHGKLTKKRQYMIESGELADIRDIDMTTRDELLQKSLQETSDKRLNEIVATIQAEQNEVIRADLTKPMIVQGVAGSGKTTIALHRLSYFIYHYQDQIKPEQMMILAPNRMFIDYISESLPELGVDRITQATFAVYAEQVLGKSLKIYPAVKELETMINGTKVDKEKQAFIAGFKGSVAFEKVVLNYLTDVRNHYLPDRPFKLEQFKIMSEKRLKQLFIKEYRYLPFEKRKEKIVQLLKKSFRTKKDEVLKHIEEQFEAQYDKIAHRVKDPLLRKETVSDLLDNKAFLRDRVKKLTVSEVTKFMKEAEKRSVVQHYDALFSDRARFISYLETPLTPQQLDWLFEEAESMRKKKTYSLDDLPALLVLKAKIDGIDPDLKMKYVVIDEGQDYSVFQIRALIRATGTKLFNVLGDVTQGIYSYRGISDWDQLMNQALPSAQDLYLKKSYRTTIEIMNLASAIVSLGDKVYPVAEPVVRHGDAPAFYQANETKDYQLVLKELIEGYLNKGHARIALISKTTAGTKNIKTILNGLAMESQLLGETDKIEADIVIVPVHLAKGLEFDAAILVQFDEQYEATDQDLKLLYVAITRAMHKLDFVAPERSMFLLDAIQR